MTSQRLMPDHFDWHDPDTQHWLDHALYHLARYKFAGRLLSTEDSVLDVGCGSGYGSRFLANSVGAVLGIDLREAVIEKATRIYHAPNLRFMSGNVLTMMQNPRNQFSAVVCFEMIEHLEEADAEKMVARFAREFLSDSGILILSTPRYKPYEARSQNRKQHHRHEYTHTELISLLERFFGRVMLFTQTDELISAGNPDACWTYVAVASNPKRPRELQEVMGDSHAVASNPKRPQESSTPVFTGDMFYAPAEGVPPAQPENHVLIRSVAEIVEQLIIANIKLTWFDHKKQDELQRESPNTEQIAQWERGSRSMNERRAQARTALDSRLSQILQRGQYRYFHDVRTFS